MSHMELEQAIESMGRLGMTIQVWVLEFDHKHGTDIHVCGSKKACFEKRRQIVRDWISDWEQDEDKVRKALGDDAYADKLAENWGGVSGDNEFFRAWKADVVW